MEQQKNAASLGMWLFLVTEIMFFGGMFCAYLIYRLMHFNAFAAASQQLDIRLRSHSTPPSSWSAVLRLSWRCEPLRTVSASSWSAISSSPFCSGLTFLGVKGDRVRGKI